MPDAAAPTSPPTWPASMPGPFTEVPREPFLALILPHLRARGSEPMVIFDDGVELSCSAFLEATEQLAAGLRERIAPGDEVALAIGNRAEFLVAFFAILAHRAVAVMMGPSIGDAEADYIVRDRGLTLALADGVAADVLSRVNDGRVTVLRVDEGAGEPYGLRAYSSADPHPLDAVGASHDDIVDIGYTSGTTGLPKAIAFTHDEKLRYADVFLRTVPFSSDDRFLCPLHFHYGDPIWMLLVSILRHTPLVVMRKFSVSRFWSVAKRFDVTQILSIGAIPSLLLQAPPSPAERDHKVRFAVAVGVPRAQHAELVQRFGFAWVEHYGLSETCTAIALPLRYADQYVGSGALGIPVPEVETRLVDEHDVVLHGPASGELEVRGAWVPFREYLGNPEATDEILHDGWIRTGDLMRRDELGVYYFEGRRKELIRRGGENIAPAQVEDVLRTHPAVVDAAVVPVFDPVRDEEVKAYVQVDAEVTPAELAAHCAQHLAPYKVPRYIELRTEPFPRTPSQRIRKHELKTAGAHRVEGVWDREAIAARTPRTSPTSPATVLRVDVTRDLSSAIPIEEIPHLKGRTHDGVPLIVTRDERDQFERLTLIDRAHPEPDPADFPTDIVEGFHTLALLDAMTTLAAPFDPATTYGYNYGLDRVRWVSPVRIGDELHSRFECTDVTAKGDGWLVRYSCTVTVAGAATPTMVADWLVYVLPRPVDP